MSDTTTCSNCGTEVPAAAAFCTGCGQSMRGAATPPPPPAPAPPADATQVATPGLNDSTQVAPPPPAAPPAPPASSGPWGPSGANAPAPPAAPPTGPPTSAPWTPPGSTAPAAPPTWQPNATTPPGAATFTPATPPPPAAPPGAPAWGGQAPLGGDAAWGAQPAEASTRSGGSVLGGVVGLVGAVLAIVGIFSGWVKLDTTGTVTAWSLTAGKGLLKTQTPYVILALAGFALASSLVLITGLARTAVRIITALLGVAIIGVTAANWAEIASYVTDHFNSDFKATTAIGFYLTIAGGVLVIIAALLPAKKKAA